MNAIDRISRILQDAGMDATTSLYDEALTLARQGLLGAARDRLRMLLCLDPDDGEAHLLLAKVFVAQQRWSDALAQLDAAQAARVDIPESLRQEVDAGIQNERDAGEAMAARAASREQVEIRSLKQETRNLRTENTRLFRDRNALKRRVQAWSAASAVLAGVSVTFLAILWFSPSPAPEAPLAQVAQAETVTPPPVVEAPVAAPAAVATPAPAPAPVAAPVPAAAATPTTTARSVSVAAPSSPSRSTTASKKPATSPSRSTKGKVHEVKSGDTLSGLASRYYGDSSKWTRIRDANRDKIGSGGKLALGSKLAIP